MQWLGVDTVAQWVKLTCPSSFTSIQLPANMSGKVAGIGPCVYRVLATHEGDLYEVSGSCLLPDPASPVTGI